MNKIEKYQGSRVIFWLLVCFTCSGMSGLIYEVAWVRSLELIFGTTSFAVATVLAAFMGGLACGSFFMGRMESRLRSRHPLKVYAFLEVLIGIVGLLLPFTFQWLVPLYKWLWTHFQTSFLVFSVVRLLLCILVLLAPTFLMGATLPIVSAFVGGAARQGERRIGFLYSFNTLGAVLGCLAAGLFLFRFIGLAKTQWVAVALNFVSAGGALLLASAYKERTLTTESEEPTAAERSPLETDSSPVLSRREAGLLVGIYAASGFVAMLYEVAWTRVLVLVLGSSIYAYTIMLATFLLGLSLGSILAIRFLRQNNTTLLNAGLCQLAIALTTYASLFFVEELPYYYLRAFESFNPSTNGLLTLQFVLAGALMVLPTLGLGAMFPIAMRGLKPSGEKTARVVGWAYALNTFGAIIGSVFAGFWMIPAIGSQQTLLTGVVINALLASAAFMMVKSGKFTRYRFAAAAAVVVFTGSSFINTPTWDPHILSSGIFRYAKDYAGLDREGFRKRARKIQGEVLFFKEGLTCTITVFRNPQNLILAVNGKPDASTPSGLVNPFATGTESFLGDLPTQSLVGHLPLLLGPKSTNVLVVGLGSGVTVGALLQHPVQKIECIELEEAVVQAERFFEDYNNRPLADPRVKMIVNDARNHLLVTDTKYDIIVSEPSNPWLPGPAKLFTTEFFQLAKSKLQPGGVMCQWIQLYEIHHSHFQTILRTYLDVFPNVQLFRVNHDAVLVGSLQSGKISLEELERKMTPQLKADLDRLGIHSLEELLAYHWIGGDELRQAVAKGGFNTDDNLFIEFEAPLKVIRRENEARDYGEIMALFLDRSTALLPNLELSAGTDAGAFWSRMADASLRQPHPLRAKLYAEHALQTRPTAATARIRGEALYQLGQRDVALSSLDSAERDFPDEPEIQRAIASLHSNEGHWTRVRDAAGKLAAANTNDYQARFWLGESHFQLNENDASLAALEPLATAPREQAGFAELPFYLGALYSGKGEFAKATPFLRSFLQSNPMNRDARALLADALYRSGHREEALAQWQLLGRVSSVQAAKNLREGQAALAQGKAEAGREKLEQAWRLDPWNDDLNFELARVRHQAGDLRGAIALLENYLAWKKDSPWAVGYLGQLLEQQNEKQRAFQLAARYRALTGDVWANLQ